MKNGMILHVYTHMKKGAAFFEVIKSLAPGADIKVMPRQKALNPKGPKLNGPGKANETREIIHISGDTSRGQALITLIKAANEKGANGVFISRLTFEETRKKEKAPKDNGPNLAGFDYEGYGIEKPKDMVEPE